MKFFFDEKPYEQVIGVLEKELLAARAGNRDLLEQNRQLMDRLLAVSQPAALREATRLVEPRTTAPTTQPPRLHHPGFMPNRRPPVPEKES